MSLPASFSPPTSRSPCTRRYSALLVWIWTRQFGAAVATPSFGRLSWQLGAIAVHFADLPYNLIVQI